MIHHRAHVPCPGRRGLRAALAAVLAAMSLLPATGRADPFFGGWEPLQLWPEFDAIVHAGDAFRLIAKLEPVWTPAEGNYVGGVSVYGDWLVAPLTSVLITPDLAKRRRLDVRLGLSWFPTWVQGTGRASNELRIESEATMRTNVPGGILATLRGRVEAQWQLAEPKSFEWRFRIRPQLEREFALSREAGTSLTPYVNVEFIWTTSRDMWSQFRMQAGLQFGANWFLAGQVIELNGQILTNLQPERSSSPTIGAVWYQYF